MGRVIESLTDAASSILDLPQVTELSIGKFTMFATISRKLTLESEVPTSPLEDGSDATDHIILKSIPIQIQGVVADVYVRNNPINEAFFRLQGEIGNVSKYLPIRTQAQVSKVNALAVSAADVTRKVDTLVADGEQALNFFGNQSDGQSLREQFVNEMMQLHLSKQLVSIQMPFLLLQNMRITNLVIDEDNKSEELSFTLSAIEVPKVKTIFTDITQFFKNPSTGTNGQLSGVTDKAAQAGEPVEESFATTIKNLF